MTKNSTSPSRMTTPEASRTDQDKATTIAQSDRKAATSDPVWSPMMGMIVAVIAAFLAGLFVGGELLHHPQIVEPPVAAAMSSADAGSGAPASTAGADAPTGADHNDSLVKDAISTAKDPQRLIKIGDLLSDQRRPEYRPDLAVLAYSRAIQLGSHTASLYRDLATAQMASEDMDGAEKNLKTSLRLDPKDAAAHTLLGFLLKTGHDKAGARKEFQTALDLHPSADIQKRIKTELASL